MDAMDALDAVELLALRRLCIWRLIEASRISRSLSSDTSDLLEAEFSESFFRCMDLDEKPFAEGMLDDMGGLIVSGERK